MVEKTLMKELNFPQVMFCPKAGLKSEELVAMGQDEGIPLTEDFLKPQRTPFLSNFNLTDIDRIWERGIYQTNEFNVVWKVEDGKFRVINNLYQGKRCAFSDGYVDESIINSTGEIFELNTVWIGRCLVWKAKIKARKYLPQIVFFIKALPGE